MKPTAIRRDPRAGGGARTHPALAIALTLLAAVLAISLLAPGPARANTLQAIVVSPDLDRIDVTPLGLLLADRGDAVQVDTLAGPSMPGPRMAVRATTPGTSPSWLVFALTNPTDKPIERWLTAERYTMIGSGIVWPDLDARRIEIVTPSQGYLPDRLRSERADIFRITLEAGQTITYVAELASRRTTRVYLWKPIEYEVKVRERQMLNGILLGMTLVLSVFLTAVFAASHKAIFPAAALVGWCVLGYLCVDFGFFHKLFNLRAEDNAVYRAATESAVAASLVLFLTTFLRLGSWHGFVRMLAVVWIVAQLALVGLAVIDPRLAATFARSSFALVGGLGALLTVFLAISGQDRALSLIPTWILFLVFVFAAAVTLTGRLNVEVAVPSLLAGLVLLVLLIGFTVIQFAFRQSDGLQLGGTRAAAPLAAVAIDAAGAGIWEWNARRGEIKVGQLVENALGLAGGMLTGKVDDFLKHMHPADREKFRLLLWSVEERSGGTLTLDFRLRHADNAYRWFNLDAASLPADDTRTLRCVGLLRDVTEMRMAKERLLHDAVKDNLTGLPNRELFLDRLEVALQRADAEGGPRPTVIHLDIDRFKNVNASLGLDVGDSLLLTVARRIRNHIKAQDTLARVGGDQFALLILSEQDPRELAQLAERIRRSVRAPIKIVGHDIVLTGSLGIAVAEPGSIQARDLLNDAEIAMHRAKREGADRIEIFRPDMRGDADERRGLETELRAALQQRQLRLLFQPMVYLRTEELAGFEVLARWDHPSLGRLDPAHVVSQSEGEELAAELGTHLVEHAVRLIARWQDELPRPDRPLFISVTLPGRQSFRGELAQEVRQIAARSGLPKGSLRLEIAEQAVMENPEQATELLSLVKAAGADLVLGNFGAGYSSVIFLQRFPFDAVRLDRALMHQGGDGTGMTLVRAVVSMAHELGRKVVVEGIDDEAEAGLLRSISCEFGLGYHYGEPMPEREVRGLLKLVRKTERKLSKRGFFRAKPVERGKTRQSRAAARSGGSAGAKPARAAEPAAARAGMAPSDTQPRAPATLPASTIRTRQRTEPSPTARERAPAAVPPVPAGPMPPESGAETRISPAGNGFAGSMGLYPSAAAPEANAAAGPPWVAPVGGNATAAAQPPRPSALQVTNGHAAAARPGDPRPVVPMPVGDFASVPPPPTAPPTVSAAPGPYPPGSNASHRPMETVPASGPSPLPHPEPNTMADVRRMPDLFTPTSPPPLPPLQALRPAPNSYSGSESPGSEGGGFNLGPEATHPAASDRTTTDQAPADAYRASGGASQIAMPALPSGSPQPQRVAPRNYSGLPPAIARSLAKLAGNAHEAGLPSGPPKDPPT